MGNGGSYIDSYFFGFINEAFGKMAGGVSEIEKCARKGGLQNPLCLSFFTFVLYLLGESVNISVTHFSPHNVFLFFVFSLTLSILWI